MFGPIIKALPWSSGWELLITVRSARKANEGLLMEKNPQERKAITPN
jgi:hypothetical protein